MSDSKITSFNCPKCGYDILTHKDSNYNPRKRLTELKLARNKKLNRLLTETLNLIKENVPSDNSVAKEYYFMRDIQQFPDNVVRIGIHKFLEGHHQYDGKGFNYLKSIIKYTETNKERQHQLEQKKLGKLPKPQRKGDIDE